MILLFSLSACKSSSEENDRILAQSAESYVKLCLQAGNHDPDFVDAYYGPENWKQEAVDSVKDMNDIRAEAKALTTRLQEIDLSAREDIIQKRKMYLLAQINALIGRVDILMGVKYSFDDESRILYDGVAPVHSESEFIRLIDTLNSALPGEGELWQRYQNFRKPFIVPQDRLRQVFEAALKEAQRRTRAHIDLPAGESFDLEFVHDEPWGAYNWYQGRYHSLIQINQDLPIYIDRVVGLVCHEGYPGHHVYNVLLEENLYNKRGWVEYCVYPLFSPQSLIAEGTANYAVALTFPDDDRLVFEQEILFPLAGLEPNRAEAYYRVVKLFNKVRDGGTEAARQYLDGTLSKAETIDWLMKNSMASRERAEQNIRFFEKYRSYQINYSLGLELVTSYIDRQVGANAISSEKWQVFESLLNQPFIPSNLN